MLPNGLSVVKSGFCTLKGYILSLCRTLVCQSLVADHLDGLVASQNRVSSEQTKWLKERQVYHCTEVTDSAIVWDIGTGTVDSDGVVACQNRRKGFLVKRTP